MKSVYSLVVVFIMFSAALQANQTVDAIDHLLVKQKVATQTTSPSDPTKHRDLSALQQHYRLLFVYSASCPHCQRSAPVIADFSRHFNIQVDAFSNDGAPLAGFEGRVLSPVLFQTLFVNAGIKPMLPALFLINSETSQVYPVLFGETTGYQLALRMDELVTHIEEQFDGGV